MQYTACAEVICKTIAINQTLHTDNLQTLFYDTQKNQFKNNTSIVESNISNYPANITESSTLNTLLVLCQTSKLYYRYLEIWLML
jgi:hypothetical protein